jgi:addiction module HigA family antidote
MNHQQPRNQADPREIKLIHGSERERQQQDREQKQADGYGGAYCPPRRYSFGRTILFSRLNVAAVHYSHGRCGLRFRQGRKIVGEGFLTRNGFDSRASQIGWTVAKLNELIKGKRGVTADSALDLAEELGTSPEVWINLQMQFDLKRALSRRKHAS